MGNLSQFMFILSFYTKKPKKRLKSPLPKSQNLQITPFPSLFHDLLKNKIIYVD